jgi:GNAT superfamily N-acetyltransferase
VSAAPGPLLLRAATADDLPQILAFIDELADYEKLRHEVHATLADLRVHLFGARPAAEVLIAEWESRAAGFALFFTTFSTFLGKPGLWLEDLYVRPELRGKGIGRALLAELARQAAARGYGRVDWAVLDWNEPAKSFYHGLGARQMKDWRTWRLTGEALLQLGRRELGGK